MKNGMIADIERASADDGNGMRTVVFFKGCPLSCLWCHNPECISFEKEVLLYPKKCIRCGKCDEGCFSGARVTCGTEMSPDELLKEIKLDYDYYGEDGGVTFSGGEPMAQSEFLTEMLNRCEDNGINAAIETSLILYNKKIFEKLQVIMADLKIWNDDIHMRYTGVSNVQIKKNFIKLNSLGIPIIARTPIVPEIKQGIPEISDFLRKLENVKKYELMPYHRLGEEKREALGMKPNKFSIPNDDEMKELMQYAYIR